MPDDLPRFDMSGIYRRRNRLMQRCVRPRENERLQGDDLATLAADIRGNMPSGISRDTIYESVRYMAGRVLTAQEGLEFCWRLAGNVPRLKAGTPATPWTSQNTKEWIPLQVLRCAPYRNPRGKFGYNFDFRVLAGSPCPMKIMAFWPRELVRMMSTRMGFSKWTSGQYPFHHGEELVGLRLLGELDPLRSQHSPTFYEVAVPGSFVKWNRDNVLKIRCRVEPCPRGHTHACRQCAVGYSECPAGTHRQDYVQRFCHKCGQENVWFDLDLTDERCMDCQIKELTRKVD
jgi:hypothetical protein